jgi:8-amino-7-oxononanoate synthase
MQSAPGPETVIDGRRYVYFGGTGYLGLAGHPEVIEAACAAVRLYGVHSATSRSGFGTNPSTRAVEQRAATFFNKAEAFYFSSGYAGNHIVVQALADRVDAVFVDAAAHYAITEAARLLGKPIVPFKHRDAEDLKSCLRKQSPGSRYPLVMSDGVFSVSGAIAPVAEYMEVLKSYGPSALHLDDAHGVGVLGENGRGLCELCGFWDGQGNLEFAVDGVTLTACGTLSKAIGGFGGIIAGSAKFMAQVRHASHYFEGASAPSSADAGATEKTLEIVQREPGLRRQLHANAAQLRAGLRTLGLAVPEAPTAHFSLEIGDAAAMRTIHARLRESGFLVPYMRAYAGIGPQGALRFAACALHTSQMIEGVVAALGKIL